MNLAYKTAEPFPETQRKDISLVELKLFINKTTFPPRIKRKTPVTAANEFMPVEILSTYWSDWNEADMIKYKAVNGETYFIQDDNLLKDVVKFMNKNKMRGLYPYIHIEGKHYWECYPAPSKEHLLEYVNAYNHNYDIYASSGMIVKKAYEIKRN